MLLLKTKLRNKLITYAFTNPQRDYYVRELSNLIQEDAGNLSRELRALEEEGLFKSFVRGREKFYSLDKRYSLYNELKDIVFKSGGVKGALSKLIAGHKGIRSALIYGSYAQGKERGDSDIDLLLEGKFPVNKFTAELRNLESQLGREINFTYYSPEEFKAEKAKKGSFLNIVLKDKVIILKGNANA